jgi:hypothetical protein
MAFPAWSKRKIRKLGFISLIRRLEDFEERSQESESRSQEAETPGGEPL